VIGLHSSEKQRTLEIPGERERESDTITIERVFDTVPSSNQYYRLSSIAPGSLQYTIDILSAVPFPCGVVGIVLPTNFDPRC
jgi:hypothetical protein